MYFSDFCVLNETIREIQEKKKVQEEEEEKKLMKDKENVKRKKKKKLGDLYLTYVRPCNVRLQNDVIR